MVLRSTLNFRANSLLLIFIFTFSINSLSFGKSVRLEIVNSELISIAICIIFTSNKLCNNLSQLYIVIQSFLYILKLSFIMALRNWVEKYKGHGGVKKEITRRSKYTDKEKRKAVNHYLEFGKCYTRTCKMLGYPSRGLLTQWVKELAPQPRKFKRNGLKLTSEEKEAAVLSFLTRGDTSAQSVADKVGVSREVLYKYKDQLLGKGVPINKMSKSTNTDINKLKDQVKQLQEEV